MQPSLHMRILHPTTAIPAHLDASRPPPPSAGISLHSPGFVPYCATFFIFSDYMRNPMRMAALSEVRAGAWWCCAWWPWVAQYVCAVPDQ